MHIINYLTTIHFGAGPIASLAQILSEIGISKPLIVSDHGVEAAGLFNGEGLQIIAVAPAFLDVPTNHTETRVQEALPVGAHDCRGMLAINSGSPIDLAKVWQFWRPTIDGPDCET
ncbi:iron-containing alcohol dehydrogenase [Brucella sp. BE17]|uniref:iron-containing alcohol dehydrogenase n=1 Tax=Brucella sp. BE17 TaxID=3142977 RepID=UPI0031B9F6E4